MDPITTALILAITHGISSGIADVGKEIIANTYEALKSSLRERFGLDSQISKAIDNLEAKPESLGRQTTLKEEVEAERAYEDPEILKIANLLVKYIDNSSNKINHSQKASGTNIAQANHDSTAKVQITKIKKE